MNHIVHAPIFIKQLPHAIRLTWLKAMSDAGFPLIKIWGCSPRDDVRLPFEKNGESQMRLRCFCYSGRKGIACGSEGKHPIEGKDKNKSFRINYSYEVAKRTPKLNWGAPTGEQSGYIVLDIDPDKGGFESLKTLLADTGNGELPPTFTVLTGGGTHIRGKHLFFKHPGADWHIKSLADHPKLGIGIDVKGEGGYVVAAGSLHHSGNYYRPEADLSSPSDITLTELPEWLLKKIGKLKSELPAQAAPLTPEQIKAMAAQFRRMKASGNSQGLEKWAESALQGECETVLSATSHGNQTQVKAGFRIGGIVGAGLLNYTDALAALLDAANTRGGKSSGTAARRSIENGLRAGMLHPRFPTPKDEKVKSALDIALEEWIAAGGRAYSLKEVLKPEYFEVVQDANDNWEEFDAAFGATLEHEQEFEQSDPEGYAKFCEDEAERQRNLEGEITKNLSAVEQINLWERQLIRAGVEEYLSYTPDKNDYIGTEAGCDLAEEEYQRFEEEKKRTPEPPEGIFRCVACYGADDRCVACRDAISQRPNMCELRTTEGHGRCHRGNKSNLVSTVFVKSITLHHPCGTSGCPNCGPGIEEDHRLHFVTIVSEMEKGNNILLLPDRSVHSAKTKPVTIQSRVVVVRMPSYLREGYAEKLRLLMKRGEVWYFDGYAGYEMNTFFIMMAPGFNPNRLYYTAARKAGKPSWEHSQEIIDYAEFFGRVTHLAHEHGQSIKLAKSVFDMCDKPFGARNSHNRWNWCSLLKPPKRSEPTGKWKRHGMELVSEEELKSLGDQFRIHMGIVDKNKFDKGYLRGLTPYLCKVISYKLMDDNGNPIDHLKISEASPKLIARLYGFLDAITKKNLVIEAADDEHIEEVQLPKKNGNCYHIQPLLC